MNYTSFNQHVANYPMTQSNYQQPYYNQQRNQMPGYSQVQYDQTPCYPQQQVPSYYDRREVSMNQNYGMWNQHQVPSPHEAYYYSYGDMGSASNFGQQAPTSHAAYGWPVQLNMPYDYSPQSNFSALTLPSPPADPRPVADKKQYVVTDEEKRSSILWRMLHEIDSVEDLARNMSGSRPLAKLSIDDVERFEASDETNVPMMTDNLILNIPPDSVGTF